jgi:hypothetical protein
MSKGFKKLLAAVKKAESVRNIADNIKLVAITKHSEDPTLAKVIIQITNNNEVVKLVIFANDLSKWHYDKKSRFKHFNVNVIKTETK